MSEPIYCEHCGSLLIWKDDGWFCNTHGEFVVNEDSIECERCHRHRAVFDGMSDEIEVYKCEICEWTFRAIAITRGG